MVLIIGASACKPRPLDGLARALCLTVVFAWAQVGGVEAGPNTWTAIGPPGQNVLAVAIDPAAPTTLYAGTNGGGVFTSIDGGTTWSVSSTGLTSLVVRTLLIDPTTPATLYAGTNGGVFKSTNGGTTWAASNTGLANLSVQAMAIDPSAPATIYAGTGGDGLFKSTDGAASWSPANTGLTNAVIRALAISPTAPATIYVGTSGSAGFGVFTSHDAGASWVPSSTGLTAPVQTFAIDPTTPTTIYVGTFSAGVFKSLDGGTTWSPMNTGLTDLFVNGLIIDPATRSTLYAGTFAGGVFRSTDAGASWSLFDQSLVDLGPNVWTLAIGVGMPTTLYAGSTLSVLSYTFLPPIRTFELADGAVGPDLTTYLLILNPDATRAAPLTIDFRREDGVTAQTTATVGPRQRFTLALADVAPLLARADSGVRAPAGTLGVATTVRSTAGVSLVVEEATYLADFGDGTRALATTSDGLSHYFAEGSEQLPGADFFDTFLLLGNASATDATATVKLLRDGEAPVTRVYRVGHQSRRTIMLGAPATAGGVPEVAGHAFAAVVTSDVPVSASRSMFFGPGGSYAGGHAGHGVEAPHPTWLFAEGSTQGGFQTFFEIANPQPFPVTTTLTYHLTTGTVVTETRTVPAMERRTVLTNVADPALLTAADFWTEVTATGAVVVERSMYRADTSTGQWVMGHATPGTPQARPLWGIAEGKVGSSFGFETYLLLANPNPALPVHLSATIALATGGATVRAYTIAPGSRKTIRISTAPPASQDEIQLPDGVEFGMILQGTNNVPFVAESAIYWNGFTGGTASIAQALP